MISVESFFSPKNPDFGLKICFSYGAPIFVNEAFVALSAGDAVILAPLDRFFDCSSLSYGRFREGIRLTWKKVFCHPTALALSAGEKRQKGKDLGGTRRQKVMLRARNSGQFCPGEAREGCSRDTWISGTRSVKSENKKMRFPNDWWPSAPSKALDPPQPFRHRLIEVFAKTF